MIITKILLIVFSSIYFLFSQNNNLTDEFPTSLVNDTAFAHRLNNFAYSNYLQDTDLAVKASLKALSISDSLIFVAEKAKSLRVLGMIQTVKSNYPKGLDYFQQAIKIYNQLEMNEDVAKSLNNIGVIHKNDDNLEQALLYFQQALELFKNLNSEDGIAISYANIGDVYFNREKFVEAEDYYRQSLAIYSRLGMAGGESNNFNALGNIYFSKGKYQDAIDSYFKTLGILREIKIKTGRSQIYVNLAKSYFELKDYEKSELYIQHALIIARNAGLLKEQRDAQKIYSDIYKLRGDYKMAYMHFGQFAALNDSVYNSESSKKITSLELKYQFDMEKASNEIIQNQKNLVYEAKIRADEAIRNSLILGTMVLIVFSFVLYRNYKSKKKSAERLQFKNDELEAAFLRIKTLEGIMPVCSSCKKIRKEESDPAVQDNWQPMESYIMDRTNAEFTHSICPSCSNDLLADLDR